MEYETSLPGLRHENGVNTRFVLNGFMFGIKLAVFVCAAGSTAVPEGGWRGRAGAPRDAERGPASRLAADGQVTYTPYVNWCCSGRSSSHGIAQAAASLHHDLSLPSPVSLPFHPPPTSTTHHLSPPPVTLHKTTLPITSISFTNTRHRLGSHVTESEGRGSGDNASKTKTRGGGGAKQRGLGRDFLSMEA
ncbi:hypothetical protein E2C01_005480 [Portunus trituberculatus]|uniref:Uncharacterized protein n=1 Tax=Portunus trituberculatus TaxID=210409 RepID=A0A5B7CSV5_PORTR|nr:hypothetical protein [Portunus trituberculatus]